MSGYSKNQFDGDQSAKTMDAGASSAAKNLDFTDGIHEDAKIRNVHPHLHILLRLGTAEGAIGGTAQKVGGPFDAQGAIGKQFTDKGSIGGTVQEHLGQGESNSIRK
ncbi:hypothetical protein SLS56_005093 [Neofusicoccum ribis]|uniref:Uncharacterized protein n=1 Tax=Neofusicoccum ribis TaxID=45134 RepID=A0ABR3SVA8_9PEZI